MPRVLFITEVRKKSKNINFYFSTEQDYISEAYIIIKNHRSSRLVIREKRITNYEL